MPVRRSVAFAGILVIGVLARGWGISFGLPAPYSRPDEEAVASVALLIFGRNFNPHFFDWPTLFMYVVAACLVPYFQVGRYLGWFRGESHFVRVVGSDPTMIFLIARTLSVIAGVSSVWIVHRIARRMFDEATALVAAAFLALAFLHARDSHFGVTDVPATCLILVSFLCLLRFADSGSRSDLVKAAMAAGLATSTKYNAAIVAVPGVWLAFSGVSGTQDTMAARWGRVLRFLLVMVLAFVVTSPYVVLAFGEFSRAIRGVAAHLEGGHGASLGRGWVVHLTSSLRFGLGTPLLLAGIFGLVWLLVKDWRKGTLLALFPITYYVVLGSGQTVFARYILPVVPFLCLSAAFAVGELGRQIAVRVNRPMWTPAIVAAVAAIVIAPSAWSLWQFDRLLARTDSRLVAADWIVRRFPRGATVGQTGRVYTHVFFKPERPGEPSAFRTIDVTRGMPDPDVLVVPSSPLETDPGVSELPAPLLARYELALQIDASKFPSTGRVYDWQDQFYLPLTGFNGIVRPGPNLAIYVRKASR
jgi:4-amino-4-deoxy-L-arabinose transferase-like glycosyltransferase